MQLQHMKRRLLYNQRMPCRAPVMTLVPAGGQGAVDGGPLGLGDVVERVAVAMANHHLDRQQLVVGRTVTCQETPISPKHILLLPIPFQSFSFVCYIE